MASDASRRKYFALVVLSLLGLAAWLGARGVTALLDARLAAGPPAGSAPVLPPAVSVRERSAAPILARNPFDSVTGPLDRPPPPGPSAALAATSTEPLSAPPCADLEVRIVTEADDPRQSRAALQAKGDATARVYGVGDHVGDRVIAYIGFNPARRSPAVWLTDTSGLCQTLLFDEGVDASAPVAPPPVAAAAPVAGQLAGSVASAIHRHGDDAVIIDRPAVDQILSDGRRLMPDSAILFEQQDGKVLGVRVFQIAPDSLLAQLGLRSGDRIESVGGVHVSSRETALAGYQALRGSEPVVISITRNGKPQTIQLQVR